MTAASASHRLLNFVQSALLLGLMAAIAWIAVTAIVGPETGLLMALAMVGGLLLPFRRARGARCFQGARRNDLRQQDVRQSSSIKYRLGSELARGRS